jgi:hypothetical protein
LILFGSVLSQAWQPNPTTFGHVAKPDPAAFGKGGNASSSNASSSNSWLKTQQRNAPRTL